MTPKKLRAEIEQRMGAQSLFFHPLTMKLFGDTWDNYGVRGPLARWVPGSGMVNVWELYRKAPVHHQLQASAYFDCTNFERVYPSDDEAST